MKGTYRHYWIKPRKKRGIQKGGESFKNLWPRFQIYRQQFFSAVERGKSFFQISKSELTRHGRKCALNESTFVFIQSRNTRIDRAGFHRNYLLSFILLRVLKDKTALCSHCACSLPKRIPSQVVETISGNVTRSIIPSTYSATSILTIIYLSNNLRLLVR